MVVKYVKKNSPHAPFQNGTTSPDAPGTKTTADDVGKDHLMPVLDLEEMMTGIPSNVDHPAKIWSKMGTEVENIGTREEAIKLLNGVQSASGFVAFLMGGILSRIKSEEWYAPHQTFAEFCEQEVGFRIRKAEYYIRIYEVIVETDIKHIRLYDLGWTKLRELVSRLPPDEIEGWLPKAMTMTVKELQTALKGEAAKSDEVEKLIHRVFHVYEGDAEVIESAVAQCKQKAGTDSDGKALQYICLEFLNGSGHPGLTELPTVGDCCKRVIKQHHDNTDAALKAVISEVEQAFTGVVITTQLEVSPDT